MKFNNKRQPYTIMGRFHVTEEGKQVEYCRVLFSNTKKSQIVKGELVKSGEFEDSSLVNKKSDIVNIMNNAPSMDVITDTKIDLSGVITTATTDGAIDLSNSDIIGYSPIDVNKENSEGLMWQRVEDSEPLVVKEEQPEPPVIFIATNPEGEDAEVDYGNIAAFCEQHSLDLEAVEACLAGNQKTHKKWRFVFA